MDGEATTTSHHLATRSRSGYRLGTMLLMMVGRHRSLALRRQSALPA